MQDAVLLRRLAEQAVSRTQQLAAGTGRKGETGHTPEASIGLGDVDRAHRRPERSRQKGQHGFAEMLETLLALDALAELDLRGAQPRLGFPRPVVARGHHGGHDNEDQEQRRPAAGHQGRQADGGRPVVLPAREQRLLVTLDLGNHRPDAIHGVLAAVAADDRERALGIAGTPKRDGLAELLQFLGGEPLQRVDPLTRRGVGGALAQALQSGG